MEIVRRLFEHWARGEYPVAGFFDPEIEYSRSGLAMEIRGADLAGEWHGLEGLRAATVEFFSAFPEMREEAERIVDLGDDRVLVLSRETARGKVSGARVERETAYAFTLRDGKIVRCHLYWDRAEALEAAGLRE